MPLLAISPPTVKVGADSATFFALIGPVTPKPTVEFARKSPDVTVKDPIETIELAVPVKVAVLATPPELISTPPTFNVPVAAAMPAPLSRSSVPPVCSVPAATVMPVPPLTRAKSVPLTKPDTVTAPLGVDTITVLDDWTVPETVIPPAAATSEVSVPLFTVPETPMLPVFAVRVAPPVAPMLPDTEIDGALSATFVAVTGPTTESPTASVNRKSPPVTGMPPSTATLLPPPVSRTVPFDPLAADSVPEATSAWNAASQNRTPACTRTPSVRSASSDDSV